MKTIILFCLTILSGFTLCVQVEKSDSLERVLDMPKTSTAEQIEIDKALDALSKTLELGHSLGNAAVQNVANQNLGENLRPDSKLEVLIYRCAYELVNNAIKHANVTDINVQMNANHF